MQDLNINTFFLIVILVVIGYMAYQQYLQAAKVDRAEEKLDNMYQDFEKYIPVLNKIAKFFGNGDNI